MAAPASIPQDLMVALTTAGALAAFDACPPYHSRIENCIKMVSAKTKAHK